MLGLFLPLNFSKFRLKLSKGLRVTKNITKVKFEGVSWDLEPKKGFQSE